MVSRMTCGDYEVEVVAVELPPSCEWRRDGAVLCAAPFLTGFAVKLRVKRLERREAAEAAIEALLA